MSKLFDDIVEMQKATMKAVQPDFDNHYDIKEPVELVSECCGAKVLYADANGVGVCSDCKEICEEVETN